MTLCRMPILHYFLYVRSIGFSGALSAVHTFPQAAAVTWDASQPGWDHGQGTTPCTAPLVPMRLLPAYPGHLGIRARLSRTRQQCSVGGIGVTGVPTGSGLNMCYVSDKLWRAGVWALLDAAAVGRSLHVIAKGRTNGVPAPWPILSARSVAILPPNLASSQPPAPQPGSAPKPFPTLVTARAPVIFAISRSPRLGT